MTDKEFFDWLIDYIFECDENEEEVVAEVIYRKLIKAGKLKAEMIHEKFETVFKCVYFDRCKNSGRLNPEYCKKPHVKIVEEDGSGKHCCRIDVDLFYENAYENLMSKIQIVQKEY